MKSGQRKLYDLKLLLRYGPMDFLKFDKLNFF